MPYASNACPSWMHDSVAPDLPEVRRETTLSAEDPLGTRGKLATGEYEAIGFQIRSITVDGVVYPWAEYLLYNPYKGYRYLTEYNGHWNDIRTLRAIPSQYQRLEAGRNLRRKDVHAFPNRTGSNGLCDGRVPVAGASWRDGKCQGLCCSPRHDLG